MVPNYSKCVLSLMQILSALASSCIISNGLIWLQKNNLSSALPHTLSNWSFLVNDDVMQDERAWRPQTVREQLLDVKAGEAKLIRPTRTDSFLSNSRYCSKILNRTFLTINTPNYLKDRCDSKCGTCISGLPKKVFYYFLSFLRTNSRFLDLWCNCFVQK